MRYLFFSLFLMMSAVVFGRNYYISSIGEKNTFPFSDLDLILGKLEPGDTLFFHEGEYMLSHDIRPLKSGTADKRIVLRNVQGERVIFNGSDFKTNPETGQVLSRSRTGLITFKDVSYIDLIGVEVTNSHNIGIVATGENTTHIRIIDCKSHGSYNSGIALWYSRNCLIEYCEITGANDQELRTTEKLRREGPHEALTIAGAEYFEIRYNHIHSCEKEGIDCKEVSAYGVIHHNFIHDLPRQGLYVDSWFGKLHNIEFHSNIVFACEWGMAISAEGEGSSMENIDIHHNLLFENRGSGLLFGVWGNDRLRKNLNIYNNTIVHNGSAGHWAGKTGGIDMRTSNLSNVNIFNNIISENYGFEFALFTTPDSAAAKLDKRNIRIKNNVIHKPHQAEEPKGFFNPVYSYTPDNNILSRPEFKNTGFFNYSLEEGSQLRRKGIRMEGTFSSEYLGAGEDLYIWFNNN